jgi:hypothetical protein
MAKGIPSSFGDVRSILHARPVQRSAWYELSRALGFFDAPETLWDEVLPYCVDALADWPHEPERTAPNNWVFGKDGRVRHELHPCLALARRVELHDRLTEDGAVKLIDALRLGLIEHLQITHAETSQGVFTQLLDATVWGSLRSLRYTAPLSSDALRRFFSSPLCSELGHIDLSRTGVNDDIMALLAERDDLHRLESLSLNENAITRVGVEHLLEMKSLENLSTLELLCNDLEPEDEALFFGESASIRSSVLDLAWTEYYGDVFE